LLIVDFGFLIGRARDVVSTVHKSTIGVPSTSTSTMAAVGWKGGMGIWNRRLEIEWEEVTRRRCAMPGKLGEKLQVTGHE
jgi:hypothetical protein